MGCGFKLLAGWRLGRTAKLCGTNLNMKLTQPDIKPHAILAKFALVFSSAQPRDGAQLYERMFDGGGWTLVEISYRYGDMEISF